MFSQDFIEKLLYIDVETVPSYGSLEELERENERLYKLWLKRDSYYRSAHDELKNSTLEEVYNNKAGLEPEFSKIVCVSFGSFDTANGGEKRFVSFYGEDEKDILAKSAKVLSNASLKSWKLCGHNIKGFDIPCIGKRLIYNRIDLPSNIKIWDKKPWEMPFIDTSDIFAFGSWVQQKYLSLDLLSCSLGISSPKENLDGSQVRDYYWNKKDYESIKEYCQSDVDTVMKIMLALV